MLRRSYAFEAEGVPEEVVDSLETVEDVVDQNCATPADCDAMLEKVEQQEEKFDGALQDMADAAKDAQASGNSGALAESIEPAMNELREVAEDTGIAIGTAAEGFGMTQNDLLRIRSYLVGTREIIESKKAELMGMESSYAMESDSGDDDDDEDDSDSKSKSDDDEDEDDSDSKDSDDDEDSDDEEEKKAEEAFLYDYCLECYMDELDEAMDSEICAYAMEGVTVDAAGAFTNAIKVVRGLKKEMKAAEAEGDYHTAAAKAKECASKFDEVAAKVSSLPQSASSAVLVNGAVALVALGATALAVRGGKALGKKVGAKMSYDARLDRAMAKNAKLSGDKAVKHGEKLAKMMEKHEAGAAKKAAKDIARGNKAINKNRKLTRMVRGNAYKLSHSKAATAGKNVVNGIGTNVGKVTGGISNTLGKAPKPVKMIGKGAAVAGKTAAKGIGAGAAATGLLSFLKKKQVVDEEGNAHSSRLESNDVNAVIAMVRKLCAENKKKFLDLAAQYEEMAANASSSAAAESFIDLMDGMKINSTPAAEGFDVDSFYEGFFGAAKPATEAIDAQAFLNAFINGDE